MKERSVHGDMTLPAHHIPRLIRDASLRSLPWMPVPMARNHHRLPRRLHRLDLGGGRRVHEVSRRNTCNVDHHPLRAFAPLGFADTGPLFGRGIRLGQACQRAPVRSIHSIPAKQGRLGSCLGLLHGEAWGAGNKGTLFSHCSSVSYVSGHFLLLD
jgi:hypothetical protein